MVIGVSPGKFYGSSLPRPRFYTNFKFSHERIDPPISFTEPLMSWAEDAHWSMGGLNLNRHRLQGRIEGSVTKLRAEREEYHNDIQSPSPPPAPMRIRRRKYMELVDESEDEDEQSEIVRSFAEDFDLVAGEMGKGSERVGVRTRSRRSEEEEEEEGEKGCVIRSSGSRKSRRLVKRWSM